MNDKLFVVGINKKYDPRLLNGRVEIEGNLIGCFANDTTLLSDTKIESKNFLTKDGRFYFALFKNLVNKGFNKIDEVTILTNSKQEVIDGFEERGGYDTLSNLMEIINPSNFDGYLEQFNRSNLLCQLYRDGFNLFEPTTVHGKEIIPFKLFQKMSTTQIVDYYDMQLSSYDLGQNSAVIEEEFFEFEDGWEEKLEEQTEMGTPYDVCGVDVNGKEIRGFKFLSSQTLGLHHSNLMMLAGFSGVGKSTMFVPIIMSLLYRGEKIIVISNEEKIQKYKIKFMAWLLRNHCHYGTLTKSKLSKGMFGEEDKRQIRIAKKYFNDNYKGCLRFVSINTNDIHLIKKKIRDAHLKYGFTGFLLDTFKLTDDSFSGERQDLAMVRDSRELHSLAMKYDLIGMCSCQCGQRFLGALTLTANVLAGSKQTKEILSQLLMVRNLYEEELNPKSQYYCQPYLNRKKEGEKRWSREQIAPDPKKTYIVVAIEKNRDGNDTGGSGDSYLVQFDGHNSSFEEICMVRTKHGVIQG